MPDSAVGPELRRLDAVSYEMIVDALKNTNGNMSEAARELGITRHALRLRMDRHGLDFRKYRV